MVNLIAVQVMEMNHVHTNHMHSLLSSLLAWVSSPQELRLYTDYGRCCRPLFIVEDQAIRVNGSGLNG
jgi:hypothetical protein